jgi:hypothetical protein
VGGPVPHSGRHCVSVGVGGGASFFVCARVPVVAGVRRPGGARLLCVCGVVCPSFRSAGQAPGAQRFSP